MERIVLQLPVPKYLKRILTIKFGEDYQPKLFDSLGLIILGSLQTKRRMDYEVKKNPRFNDNYCVLITQRDARYNGYKLSKERIYRISKTIEKEIKEELFSQCITNKTFYDIDYKTTILNFLDLYDIPDNELNYETLRKYFNRFYDSPKNKKLINNLTKKG